jgi:lactoylglutathione lyase
MPSYKLGHVHLNTHDLDAAVAYYQRMFGATLLSKGENLPGRFSATLDISGLRIIISNKMYPLDAPALPASAQARWGLEHFALVADDFQNAVADLKTKGAEFTIEPREFRPGFWIAFVKAPEEVLIEILSA